MWTDGLPHAHFARLHRSVAVHVEHVTGVERGADRTYTVHERAEPTRPQ